jgi:hypothetical protein
LLWNEVVQEAGAVDDVAQGGNGTNGRSGSHSFLAEQRDRLDALLTGGKPTSDQRALLQSGIDSIKNAGTASELSGALEADRFRVWRNIFGSGEGFVDSQGRTWTRRGP